MQLAVVLPTFNERDNVLRMLERIERSLAGMQYEVMVVDDDSPDGTAALVREYGSSHANVRVIQRTAVRGLRTAIQEGIDRTASEAVVWMDCDLSVPPEALPRLHAALRDADVAVGSRYVPGGADARGNVPLHRLFSWVLNGYLRTLLGGAVTDYTSGFVCARRAVVDAIRLTGDYGEYCIDFLHRARKRGFRVVELPYHNAPRTQGESKTVPTLIGLLRRGWRYVLVGLQLRRELGR